MDIVERLKQECDRYGLPSCEPVATLEVLLRHIYANRTMTEEMYKLTIETLKQKRYEAWSEGARWASEDQDPPLDVDGNNPYHPNQ